MCFHVLMVVMFTLSIAPYLHVLRKGCIIFNYNQTMPVLYTAMLALFVVLQLRKGYIIITTTQIVYVFACIMWTCLRV